MGDIADKVKSILQAAAEEFKQAKTADALEKLRVTYLGRRGVIRDLMQKLGSLPAQARPEAGKLINSLKQEITSLHERAAAVKAAAARPHQAPDALDVTLPGAPVRMGKPHPLTRATDEIVEIFGRMGFTAVYGPEIETVHHNFEALNMPLDHPSRDAFDTFFIKGRDDLVLRSHTSPVQVRVMKSQRPPLRIVVPGRTYRPDTVDATHSFMFSQVEGLVVDSDISMADLKFCLNEFATAYFGEKVKTRFRPHYFPFTEPSAEMDVSCIFCGGEGCRVCGSGWIEVLGCGMVHPNVFRAVDYDPEEYTGFAFGMGVERLCMLKHQIHDLRLFFENDVRFLNQF